ncbi:hypothetical protein KIS4809_3417 [Bacillus sp. ZZV12-4809]|nr:hypothetical protein KIS4809_3417 [Bacillus sp. ZZV12-4809]
MIIQNDLSVFLFLLLLFATYASMWFYLIRKKTNK